MRNTSRFIIILFFFLGENGNLCFAQNQSVIDSLEQIAKTAKNDSVIMDAYNKLRRATYYSDPKSSLSFTNKFFEYAKRRKDSLNIAMANFYLGNSYVTNGEFEPALDNYLKAAVYFETKGDKARLSSVYNGIAAAYENNGNDSLSLNYFTQSFEISKSEGDQRRMGIALNNISNVHKARGDIAKAISYLERAVDNLQEPSSAKYLPSITINLANAYTDNKEYEKAMPLYDQLLKTTDTIEDIYFYGAILRGLGNIHRARGNTKTGIKYLENSFRKYTKHNFLDERYDTMKDLVDAYKEDKRFEESLGLFYEYNTIKDSIFNSEKDKNLTESLQKYEAEKKDREILEQKYEVQRRVQERNRILWVSLSLGVLSVVILLFLRNRLKYQKTISHQTEELQQQKITDLQQKNKLLALNSMIEGQESERLRIAKDLHDSLGGLLSTVKAHFSTIQKEIKQLEEFNLTEKTNGLIDEACLEVRRISHNMMPHALSISGLQGAIEDLGEHLNEQGFSTTVEISNLPEKTDKTKEVMVYRLVQEIISNIRKHADAKNILIQLIGFNKEITLIIEDDGKGFNYDDAIHAEGLGLKSIKSRVEFLDGTINWDTQVNKGTSVTINIPTL